LKAKSGKNTWGGSCHTEKKVGWHVKGVRPKQKKGSSSNKGAVLIACGGEICQKQGNFLDRGGEKGRAVV